MAETKQITVAIEPDLLERIDRMAERSRRSRTQQVVFLLEQVLRESVLPEKPSLTSPSV